MPTSPLHRSGLLALVSASLVLGMASAPAEARRGARHAHVAKSRALPAKAAKKEVAATTAAEARTEPAKTWTAGEPGEKSCLLSRRKLWQPGEGWMVKRVKVCP